MNDALVIEVVRKTVTVDCSVEEAFRIFTTDALSWWPVESHSIHQTVSEIVFEAREGGDVYEVSSSGERGHWATVLEWDPPNRLCWLEHTKGRRRRYRGRGAVPRGRTTRVELEHRGWERLVESAEETRESYDSGWEFVLGKYVDFA